jgi:hypothetical protein
LATTRHQPGKQLWYEKQRRCDRQNRFWRLHWTKMNSKLLLFSFSCLAAQSSQPKGKSSNGKRGERRTTRFILSPSNNIHLKHQQRRRSNARTNEGKCFLARCIYSPLMIYTTTKKDNKRQKKKWFKKTKTE